MGRFKQHWTMDEPRVGFRLTNRTYMVTLTANLTSDPERLLTTDLEPDEAERLGKSLIASAEEARKFRENLTRW